MGFWIFMFCMVLLIPVTMIVFGRRFLHHPPKTINSIYGYRTRRSMRDQESWEFAHRHIGKLWLRSGWIVLAISIVAMICVYGRDVDFVGMFGGVLVFIQMIPMLGAIWPTERELKKRFGD